jgi:acyl-CoA synthetase (NDP forming)
MGGRGVAEGVEILNAGGIPTFSYPDAAVRSFESMWSYSERLQALAELPVAAVDCPHISEALLANLMRYTRKHAFPHLSDNRHRCSADLPYLSAG